MIGSMSGLHAIPTEALEGSFEKVAELARDAKRILEERGVRLSEPSHHDEAGPVRHVAVELGDGTQFLIVEHYAHPDGFLELRAQVSRTAASDAIRRFSRAAGVSESDILWAAV
jgi:hypothetical protein